ncbi:MAG: glycosyltransferase family 4 protein [Propionibacteriaceae bacterium]|nr:glycosyltransferase family 4 protein [Propionibacteriaceae bacterium]
MPGIISRSLVGRGHEVDVVTGFPNYPSGRLYPGYSVRPYQRETIRGVTVHRAPLYPSHDSQPLRRAANFLSFAAAASVAAWRRLAEVDVLLVHSTPATVAIPALTVKALRRKPFVVHIQDLWPQTVLSSGFLEESGNSAIERILHPFCDSVYRHADTIAVTAPGMVDLVASRGVDPGKIVFVPNWADEVAFRPAPHDPELARSLGIDRSFTIMYAGNFGEFQALDVLIDAATILRDRQDIGFALVGGGVEEARLRSTVEERGLRNVTFIGPQPFEKMATILALGDVQFVSLKDQPLFRTTLPSKLQGILAAGRPLIGAVSGDAADVVRASGAGPVVDQGSAAELAQAICSASESSPDNLRARGAAGRTYYATQFSEQVVGDRLSGILQQAAERRGRRR